MKLSNRTIINTINAIGGARERALPIKASYAISKNLLKLEKEVEAYNLEREKLLKKYAEKDEEGEIKADELGNIKFVKKYKEKWNKEISELLDIEVEVDIHKFDLSVLDNVEMSVQELMAIDFMIQE